jgi:hypothetical protein
MPLSLHWVSLLIPALVLAPNAMWAAFPARDRPPADASAAPLVLTAAENAGRLGVFVIPLFHAVRTDVVSVSVLVAKGQLLAVYYYGWWRFFRGGRRHRLLFASILRVPIPMAVAPVLYFILAAWPLASAPMLIAGLLLAVGHLIISRREGARLCPPGRAG